MGKNQAYKAMQRAKMGTSTAAGGPGEEIDDGMMDGSFHSPEWHAARLASLQTSHTVTWEEWKQKQKEEAKRQEELEVDEAKLMREYRAQLDAERAKKLARGSNHATLRDKVLKKSKRDKDRDKDKDKLKSIKKRKRSSSKKRRGRSDSESSADGSSSDNDRRKDRDRRKSRKDRKERKERHRSRRRRSESTTDSSSGSDGEEDAVALSSGNDFSSSVFGRSSWRNKS
ncbi:uncharacterized protein [Physcomitrium patens]|uniref:uncharacterized protein isoform X1 n=1 Tax=Physcomitrium patens TaxID=3218 RepID=UPI000D17E742|nr:protein pxr-1-like isoform X1 [Physcomitrium patens]|eukprot:XP_024385863.1 protein pxr-1-like isoform X1 [Physcomitrella patens]